MPGYQCVVAAVHDSPAGARAVEMAGLLAAETDATLVLVAAYRAESDAPANDPYQAVGVVAAERVLKAGAQRCTEMGAGYVPTFAVAGDAVTVLADAVRDHHADLLLVGSHGMPGMAGRLLSSAPAGAAKEGDCDVLVVHTTAKRWREPSFPSGSLRWPAHGHGRNRWLAAVDAGGGAGGCDCCRRRCAELVLVGNDQDAVGEGMTFEAILREGQARARGLGAEWVTAVVAHGDAVSGLLEAIEEHRADLLVLGSRQFEDGRLLDCVGAQVSCGKPTHVLLVH